MNAVFVCLNAKYIHASLAPWCLLAGTRAYSACTEVNACVVEGTINEQESAVLARILAKNPNALGFSCYLWNIAKTLHLAALIKAQYPHIQIALGGPEVSYNAESILRENAQIDAVFSGEGEESVPAWLDCLAQNRAPLPQNIAGFCTRVNGEIITSEPCILGQNVPSPYTKEYFESLNGRIAYLETSRGCPYSCAFCLSGRCGAPRYFDLETAQKNILLLANSGAQTIKFIDRTFNASPRHANAILSFILAHYGKEIPAGICFHFELAGDILKEESFALFEKAPLGAFQLEIGMQSFCAKTLEAVRRKTDVEILQKNIIRLVKLHTMHVHIDLIAGLPYEDLSAFANSFNTGYALGANMLQLGFLKLLHGAAMREEQSEFPCEFSERPPYEVTSTPWLTAADLALLSHTEDALERIYNSGRFCGTAAYLLRTTGLTPFDLYTEIGTAGAALGTHNVNLDDYTAFLYAHCTKLAGVDQHSLRDALVCDRLETNATGRLPKRLQIADEHLGKAVKMLAQNPDTAPKASVKRGVALLYGQKRVCFVDYTQKNPATGRYLLHTVFLDNLFE